MQALGSMGVLTFCPSSARLLVLMTARVDEGPSGLCEACSVFGSFLHSRVHAQASGGLRAPEAAEVQPCGSQFDSGFSFPAWLSGSHGETTHGLYLLWYFTQSCLGGFDSEYQGCYLCQYDPESCPSGEKKIRRQEAPSGCTQLGLWGRESGGGRAESWVLTLTMRWSVHSTRSFYCGDAGEAAAWEEVAESRV